MAFQLCVDRIPVRPRGFHAHHLAPCLYEPSTELKEFRKQGPETSILDLGPLPGPRGNQALRHNPIKPIQINNKNSITGVRLSAVSELIGLGFSSLSNQYSLVAI